MTTSPHDASPLWDGSAVDDEFDLLAQELPTAPPQPPAYEGFDQSADAASTSQTAWMDQTADPARTGLREPAPAEYAVSPGMPGRGVVLTTAIGAAGCVSLDLFLTSRVTIFFDLCFVVVCLVAAMGVRRHDLFTAGVLPPLLFAAVVAAIALTAPGGLGTAGGLSTVFLAGLAAHAEALVAGYSVALVTVAARVVGTRQP